MRKVLIFCIALLLILSAAPFAAALVAEKSLNLRLNEETPAEITQKTADNSVDGEEYIINLALSLSDEDFCDEAIKAALCIAQNNYRYFIQSGKNPEAVSTTGLTEKMYKKAKNLNKELNAVLEYKGKCVYIPTSKLSCGRTEADEKYPYIKAVASPWDCLSEDFIYDKEYASGISMYGINYLCEKCLSYKEALRWYLPDFEIK